MRQSIRPAVNTSTTSYLHSIARPGRREHSPCSLHLGATSRRRQHGQSGGTQEKTLAEVALGLSNSIRCSIPAISTSKLPRPKHGIFLLLSKNHPLKLMSTSHEYVAKLPHNVFKRSLSTEPARSGFGAQGAHELQQMPPHRALQYIYQYAQHERSLLYKLCRDSDMSISAPLKDAHQTLNEWRCGILRAATKHDSQVTDMHRAEITRKMRRPEMDVNLVSALLDNWHNKTEFIEAWHLLHTAKRTQLWRRLMLRYLEDRPEDSPMFLAETVDNAWQPIECVRDALLFMVYMITEKQLSSVKLSTDQVLEALCKVSAKYGYLPLPARKLGKLLSVLDGTIALDLYKSFLQRNVSMDEQQLLYFAYHFIRLNHGREVFQMLRNLAASKPHDTASSQSLAYAVESLAASGVEHLTELEWITLVKTTLDGFGNPLPSSAYKSLLRDALQVEDYDIMMRLWDHFQARGTEMDMKTFEVLLRGFRLASRSKLKTWDMMSRYNQVFKALRKSSLYLDMSPDLAAQSIISEVQLLVVIHRPIRDYKIYRILGFYHKYWDPSPLHDLQLFSRTDLKAARGINSVTEAQALPRPPVDVLMAILKLKFKILQNTPRKLHSIQSFYSNFVAQIQRGNPAVLPYATRPHVFNAVLKQVGKSLHIVENWPDIVTDLQDGARLTMSSTDKGEADWTTLNKRAMPRPGPDSYTWNILINAFARSHQFEAAEKAFKIMLQYRCWPDRTTYHSLLTGYCTTQDLSKVVEVLKRMKQDGLEINDDTIEIMKSMDDQTSLAEQLQLNGL